MNLNQPANIENMFIIFWYTYVKKSGYCIYILFYCFFNMLSSTMNGNKMYYNNPVTGRLSFEKFVTRRDFRKTNLHAEETHRGFSSHYIFSLGCFCTNKYNNATRSWKLLINWDWKPLSNSMWIPSSLEIHLCFQIFHNNPDFGIHCSLNIYIKRYLLYYRELSLVWYNHW